MKTIVISSIRVSPDLRKQAEEVLEQGETLSGFVLDALTRSIEYRKSRQAFIERELTAGSSLAFCPLLKRSGAAQGSECFSGW